MKSVIRNIMYRTISQQEICTIKIKVLNVHRGQNCIENKTPVARCCSC